MTAEQGQAWTTWLSLVAPPLPPSHWWPHLSLPPTGGPTSPFLSLEAPPLPPSHWWPHLSLPLTGGPTSSSLSLAAPPLPPSHWWPHLFLPLTNGLYGILVYSVDEIMAHENHNNWMIAYD